MKATGKVAASVVVPVLHSCPDRHNSKCPLLDNDGKCRYLSAKDQGTKEELRHSCITTKKLNDVLGP